MNGYSDICYCMYDYRDTIVLCQIKFFPNIVKMMSLISLVCSECSIAMNMSEYVFTRLGVITQYFSKLDGGHFEHSEK